MMNDILCCPVCRAKELKETSVSGKGFLRCSSCNKEYPVINKVPRLMDQALLAEFSSDYPEFYSSCPEDLKAKLPQPKGDDKKFKGLDERNYHETRESLTTVKYSLKRRINAIASVLKDLDRKEPGRTLELGCADGLISDALKEEFTFSELIGMDLQDDQFAYNKQPCIQADCLKMPFADNSFDCLFGAALIEHIPEPEKFLEESYRILRKDGILILTFPDPVFDYICTVTGYFKNANHLHRFSLRRMEKLMSARGFNDINGKKFMLSPFPSALFEALEKNCGCFLSPFLMNQVIYGIKK